MASLKQEEIFRRVLIERERQDCKYNHNSSPQGLHDKQHTSQDWKLLIEAELAHAMLTENISGTASGFKDRMVRVAALAFAAIESSYLL